MQTCAIHQPNFFPWLGYFDKIRRSDVFVFMDDVAYPKSGNSMSSWVNRVRIGVQGRPAWIRVPVVREHGEQRISAVRIDDSTDWRRKLVTTIEANYARAPRFRAFMGELSALINHRCEFLADYNIHAVTSLARAMGLGTRFVRQSAISAAGRSTELLVNIVRAVGAGRYLCGDGAGGYQDDAMFTREGLLLQRQEFVPAAYIAEASFLPGLSVIDFLMHRHPGDLVAARSEAPS
jgi:hypothetical protein